MDILIIAIMASAVLAMLIFNGEDAPHARLIVYFIGFIVFVSPPIVIMLYGAIKHSRVGIAMICLTALAYCGAKIGGKIKTMHNDGAYYGILIALLLGAGPIAALVFD